MVVLVWCIFLLVWIYFDYGVDRDIKLFDGIEYVDFF